MRNLILLSGKRRTGKSTLASLLQSDYGLIPVSLAQPLKAICRVQFGLTLEQTDGHLKESPTQYKDATGKYLTPRDIMIHIGKAYRHVDKDFWVNKLLQETRTQSGIYVVTDMRFRNELKALEKYAIATVRLERDEKFTGKNIDDPSETDLDCVTDWDFYIRPEYNKDLADLVVLAEELNAYVQHV